MGIFNFSGKGSGLGGVSAGLSGLSGLAGLGALMGVKGAPSKDARKVVSAFVLGKERKGSCKVPKKGERRSAKDCNFVTDGTVLKVRDLPIATRVGVGKMRICVNPEDHRPEMRQAVNAVLTAAKAGISVADRTGKLKGPIRAGHDFRVRGRKGRAGAEWPGCIVVDINKQMRDDAAIQLALNPHGGSFRAEINELSARSPHVRSGIKRGIESQFTQAQRTDMKRAAKLAKEAAAKANREAAELTKQAAKMKADEELMAARRKAADAGPRYAGQSNAAAAADAKRARREAKRKK